MVDGINWIAGEWNEGEEMSGGESLRCLKDGESWPGRKKAAKIPSASLDIVMRGQASDGKSMR